MRLALRVTGSIGLILALSIATSVIVSRHAFVRILLDLTESRLFALADDLGDVFESTVRLGLPLGQIGNSAEILGSTLPLDPQIVALAVVGPEGEVLHQAGGGLDWAAAAETRGAATTKKGNPHHVVDTGEMLIVWTGIHDPLGKITGYVGIAASSAYRNTLVHDSFGEVLILSASVLAFAILATGAGAVVACHGLSLVLRRIGQMIEFPDETVPNDALGGIGAAALGKLERVNADLNAIEVDIAAAGAAAGHLAGAPTTVMAGAR
ncbi:hypothetical protein [Skermanella stibiiresistens]|uniref:hypothetical protein n=1 Tax=Skermanella stibiiresistens TaxID=913326 RepID=UPI0004BB5F58|nr:hypothetical protein [Skermanella stibiiresistens]